MRHRHRGRTLHRTKRQRVALLRSLARSLVLHEGLTTTVAKAKELRPFIERLVSKSKHDSLAARREIVSELGEASKKLHAMKDRYAKRSGGYTRIVHLGKVGKRAIEHARIEFVQHE